MRNIHCFEVFGLVESDVWKDVFNTYFPCSRCSQKAGHAWGNIRNYHVVHPEMPDWCLTVRFEYWEAGYQL